MADLLWRGMPMRMRTLAPGTELAPFIREFRIVETDLPATRVLIPDSGMVLGFRYGGYAEHLDERNPARVPDAALAGLCGVARHMRTSAGGGVILALFREDGASEFFREPLHELYGSTVPLDDVWPRTDVATAGSRIVDGGGDAERVSALEQFLTSRRLHRTRDPIVAAAVHAIRASRGSMRIRVLTQNLGISVNRLEDRFRRTVGASPKQLAAIVRFRHAVDASRQSGSLAQASADAGYADQAHLTRDFRARVSHPPRRFLTSIEHC